MDYRIFDTLLEPVFVINQEKKVIYCNEPAALICDLSVRKITRGQRLDEILNFASPPEFLKELATVSDATPYQELSFKSVASEKQGKVQLTCQRLPDQEQGQPAWLIFFRDVTLEETLQKKYRAELEQVQHYSKNLEKMVDERTAQIRKLNSTITALLDSLGQGFFIFDRTGTCLDVHSKACDTTVECDPSQKMFWDVLKLPEKQIPGMQKWIQTIFAEMLPFEDLSPLGPQLFNHSAGKHIQLEYYPLMADGQIEGVVVVATDTTSLIEAKLEAEAERAYAKMILNLIKNKKQISSFIRECDDLLANLKLELAKDLNLDQEGTFRILHTLKGGAGAFSIKKMADVCHQAETCLAKFKWDGVSPAGVQELIELSREVEDQYADFKSENTELLGAQGKSTERWIEAPVSHFLKFQNMLTHNLPNLHEKFSEHFFQEQIGHYFKHFNEVVKSVAETETKLVAPVKLIGEELMIFPEPYENLFSTLIHGFRNAVDHGIESPDHRQTHGKPAEGHIEVSFEHRANSLLIHIQDDGGGIDPDKIRAKLTAKGLNVEGETDQQIIQHIFDSQFSTKEQVTETSGRGVGMDAIAFAAINLGGKAWVQSKLNAGTCLSIEVPWINPWLQTKIKAA